MNTSMNRFEWERQAITQAFKGEALRVLWCYATHADSDTLITFPQIRGVADETGLSVEKVGKYRKELLATGWLKESDEKTTRGNPKLVLAVGEEIKSGYLGEKQRMNPKSMSNLVPAAKQKKQAASLDTPDEAGLDNRENTGLDNRDIAPLDFPDVTTSELNNPSLTTINNQKTDVPVVADAPTVPSFDIREGKGVTDFFLNFEYANPVLPPVPDGPVGTYPSLNFEEKKVGDLTYFFVNSEEVAVSLNPLKNKSRDLVKQELQKAAARNESKKSEDTQGRDWLTELITREGGVDADRAWSLFEDAAWRPDRTGRQRGASAFFASTLTPAASAPVNKQDTIGEEW